VKHDTGNFLRLILMIPEEPPRSNVSNIPHALKQKPQWVLWKYEGDDHNPTKVPYSVKGAKASTQNKADWASFKQVMGAYQPDRYSGVGFVFTAEDEFCGIDLDHCIRPDGSLEPWAEPIVQKLKSYTEISPSGTGLKIFVRAKCRDGKKRFDIDKTAGKRIEVYDSGRYFTVTGNIWPNSKSEISWLQKELDELYVGWHADQCPSKSNLPEVVEARQCGVNSRQSESPGWPPMFERIRRCRAYVEKIPRGVQGENGSAPMLQVACETQRFALDDEAARSIITDYGKQCSPPWNNESELEHKLASAKEKTRTEYGCHLNSPSPRAGQPSGSALAERSGTREPNLTDAGNAIRLVRKFGRKIRYIRNIGWFVWDGIRWRSDEKGELELMAKEICTDMLENARSGRKTKKLVALEMHALQSESAPRIKAMVELAKSEPGVSISADSLDSSPWLFNVQNGVIDLRTGQLRTHDLNDLITKLAPVNYDLAAECPRFQTFLREIFGDDNELIAFVQKFLGFCLSGDISEQTLLIFYGEGANGKSTLIDLILWLMGDYAGTAPESLLTDRRQSEHPTELADLCGKRLVVASETESRAKLRLQRVKCLTGDSKIKGRRMRQDFVEFQRTHKLIIQTNNRPRITENSEAIWRRIRLIPFNVTFNETRRDPRLLDRLKSEASGILNFLIQGFLAWRREGFCEPSAVRQANVEFREASDPLDGFVEDCCHRDPDGWTTTRELYRAYVRRCEESKTYPLKKVDFTDALRRCGFKAERRNQGRGWRGVKLGRLIVGVFNGNLTQ
jgi:putative DNA primase/helicase